MSAQLWLLQKNLQKDDYYTTNTHLDQIRIFERMPGNVKQIFEAQGRVDAVRCRKPFSQDGLILNKNLI